MPVHVRKHTRKVNGKVVTVRPYEKQGERKLLNKEVAALEKGRYRPMSSFIDEVGKIEDDGMYVTIRGKQYPYPYAGEEQMRELISAASTGSRYNYSIKGRYF